MVQASDLDDAQVILLATQLIVESNFSELQLLAAERIHILTPDLLYRQLLNYLPPSLENTTGLVAFLKHLDGGFKDVSTLDERLEESEVRDIPLQNPTPTLHDLRLGHEKEQQESEYDDGLAAFLVQWLHKIETVCGLALPALQILDPFLDTRPQLQRWYNTCLIPLVKLQTIFYPGRAENLTTQALEMSSGVPGVKLLLQFAEKDGDRAQIGRDLDEVVSPWVYGASKTKRRRTIQPDHLESNTSWNDVNEWIYATSRSDFKLASRSFMEWDGPRTVLSKASDGEPTVSEHDAVLSYAQTGLALIATSSETGESTNILLRKLFDRVTSISTSVSETTTNSVNHKLLDASKSDLMENSVLKRGNPITYPHDKALVLSDRSLLAQRILENFKLSVPMITLLDTALFGSEDRQKQELLRILRQIPRLTRTGVDWVGARHQLYILQSGHDGSRSESSTTGDIPNYLGRVSVSFLETEFLDALILSGQYSTLSDIYLDTPNSPLDKATVQERVVAAIYSAYDNASNGNRTRGNMKRAYELLKAFQPKFSNVVFSNIDHLIRATHSLSFYQVTLQHGVPFQPATIRIHHDFLSLIEIVLAQNHKAFAKLDDLLDIGRNLVRAGLPNSTDPGYSTKSLDERLFDAQHRITYLAITAALTDHDFDTAYSYITTRLATSPSQLSQSPFSDDTSWRAAYAAGKYRPSSSPKNLHDRITGLSKRMDLLSLALTLTPTPDPLSEILATWRRCEEELDSLKSQAVEEERVMDGQSHGSSTLPGGFAEERDMDVAETRRMMERRALGGAGPTYEEEAPMGLFDVARGAASAFRKSAFPLRGPGGQVKIRDQHDLDDSSGRDSMDESRPSSEQQRVRKRDMVSNMVTGGLVSGMSWVLGAPQPKE